MALYLVNADDPRGEKVFLWDDRFYGHIILRHPSATVESIQKTIENPDMITRYVKFSDRDNYYGWGNDRDYPNAYMKVCVQFASDSGKVYNWPQKVDHVLR
jgi:hypothetical protein